MAFEDILFLRKGELIVGPKVENNNGAVEPQDARVFKTRLNFKIEQDKTGNANKAKIRIYNLSESSRTFLEQKNLVCFLKVSYQAGELTTLFFGDLDQENGIHVERSGADVITQIEAGDAESILRRANIQIGLAAGATNIQVINAAVAKLGLPVSYRTNIKEIVYQTKFAYSGTVKDLMNQQAEKAGFQWSIQNGELLIVGPQETDQQEAVLISKDTGLIGYPTKTQDKVIFKSLINPLIRPGRGARIESKIFSKQIGVNLKIEKTEFSGDTYEGDWYVKAEGRIIT